MVNQSSRGQFHLSIQSSIIPEQSKIMLLSILQLILNASLSLLCQNRNFWIQSNLHPVLLFISLQQLPSFAFFGHPMPSYYNRILVTFKEAIFLDACFMVLYQRILPLLDAVTSAKQQMIFLFFFLNHKPKMQNEMQIFPISCLWFTKHGKFESNYMNCVLF